MTGGLHADVIGPADPAPVVARRVLRRDVGTEGVVDADAVRSADVSQAVAWLDGPVG